MAIDKTSEYGTRVDNSDPNYQYGKAIDQTSPGNGTPYKAVGINDKYGLEEALLKNSNIVPSGLPDDRNDSQYYQAIQETAQGRAFLFKTAVGSTASAVVVEPYQSYQQPPKQYFDGMVVRFINDQTISQGATLEISGVTGSAIPINNSEGEDSTNLNKGNLPIVELQLRGLGTGGVRWDIMSNGAAYLLSTYRPPLELYENFKQFNIDDVVIGDDGYFYTSLVDFNLNNLPSTSPEWRKQVASSIENNTTAPGNDVAEALTLLDDKTSDDIPNNSTVSGVTVTDALNNAASGKLFRVGVVVSNTTAPQTFFFDTPFPNNCYHVSIAIIANDKDNVFGQSSLPTVNGFTVDRPIDAAGSLTMTYMAIGD